VKVLYKTSATATGGRSGVSKLDDGSFEVTTVPPGSKNEGVNPEQLFALGYSACFDNAMLLAAQRMKLAPTTCSTTIEVGLAQLESGGFGLDVDLYANIAGLSETEAQSLLETAHSVCPYSNALRGNVDVRLHLNLSF
jgi:osmotically inducible protein OsmC